MIARRRLLALFTAALGALGAAPAAAAAYPTHLIKMMVPYAAGGPSDVVARTIAEKISADLAQPVVIENRPGAGGNLGTELLARAAPDGYTVGLVLGTTLTVNPSLFPRLGFDPDKDFRPIAIVTQSANMLVVHPSLPVHSVAELVAFARAAAARGEPIGYASGGNGTPGHLVMEAFRLRAGFDAGVVPYRGNAPMVVDLVAGHVKVAFVATAGMMQYVRGGQLRGLAVSSAERIPLAPEIPTIAESGYPGFHIETIMVMLAPAGIPDAIAALLEREVDKALKAPDVIEKFAAMDTQPVGVLGAAASARLKDDRARWSKVVAQAHMHVE